MLLYAILGPGFLFSPEPVKRQPFSSVAKLETDFLAVKHPPCLFSAASPPVARARRLTNRLPPLPVHIVFLAV